jgi:hypothetical protein
LSCASRASVAACSVRNVTNVTAASASVPHPVSTRHGHRPEVVVAVCMSQHPDAEREDHRDETASPQVGRVGSFGLRIGV